MIAYKGFNVDLTCRDFQYKEGETFEFNDELKLCGSGFHACEDPLDCLMYYKPSTSVYHQVEVDDVSEERSNDDSKIVAKKIKIAARLSLKDLISTGISFRFSKATRVAGDHTDEPQASASATGFRGAASATGESGAASATGFRGAASATGFRGAASAMGICGAASATGNYGAASATGDCGAASATGFRGVASATGNYGAASATGFCGVASAMGNSGAALANGDFGRAAVRGKDSVAVALGKAGAAKANIGSWLVLAERGKGYKDENGNQTYPILNVKSFKVDGEIIKEDTYYILVNGEAKPLDE